MQAVDANRIPSGTSYEAYVTAWKEKVAAGSTGLDRDARRTFFYSKYNWDRAEAVRAQYEPSTALVEVMQQIETPQTWVVLTEDWCVDSAFALPILAEAARLNPRVALVLVPRDEHPEVMDRYLTNGARSIPKLIVFDAEGSECFRWGPRTAAATAHRQDLVAQGLEKPAISAEMAKWFEAGGWQSLDAELTSLIRDRCLAQIVAPGR